MELLGDRARGHVERLARESNTACKRCGSATLYSEHEAERLLGGRVLAVLQCHECGGRQRFTLSPDEAKVAGIVAARPQRRSFGGRSLD